MKNSEYEWISKRAYALWEDSGRQDGQDYEHWAQAKKEFDTLTKPIAAKKKTAASASSKSTAKPKLASTSKNA